MCSGAWLQVHTAWQCRRRFSQSLPTISMHATPSGTFSVTRLRSSVDRKGNNLSDLLVLEQIWLRSRVQSADGDLRV